jgi:magnesium-transporting ATPase (P-type)
MLDQFDWFFDAAALLLLIVLLFVSIIAAISLGTLPGNIARKKNHPQAEAITVLGWMGLLFVVLWPIAFVWAFVRSNERSSMGKGANT